MVLPRAIVALSNHKEQPIDMPEKRDAQMLGKGSSLAALIASADVKAVIVAVEIAPDMRMCLAETGITMLRVPIKVHKRRCRGSLLSLWFCMSSALLESSPELSLEYARLTIEKNKHDRR